MAERGRTEFSLMFEISFAVPVMPFNDRWSGSGI